MRIFRKIVVFIIILNVITPVFAQDSLIVREVSSLDINAIHIAVEGDYAYILGYENFNIVDISDPGTPEVIGSIGVHIGENDLTIEFDNLIAIHNDYAYLALFDGGWEIIDISNPEEPDRVAYSDGWDPYSSVVATDGYLYLANLSYGLTIYDITNGDDPEVINETNIEAFSIDAHGDVLSIHNSARLFGGGEFKQINISNLEELDRLDEIEVDVGAFSGLAVNAEYACVTGNKYDLTFDDDFNLIDTEFNHAELSIINVADPDSFFEVERLETDEFREFNDVVIENETVYLGTIAGLQIYDISEPAEPFRIGTYDTPGCCAGIELYEGLIYIADGDNFSIYSIQHDGPSIYVTPLTIVFDSVFVGESSEHTFTIRSWGTDTLVVSDISIDGDQFSIDFEEEISLAPDSSRDFTVSFSPDTAGAFSGVLIIVSNDSLFEEYTVDLSGIGVNPGFVKDDNPLLPDHFSLSTPPRA